MQKVHLNAIQLTTVHKQDYKDKDVAVSVLRLDELHPVISGNKWFKLNTYLKDASVQQKKVILTFGGAYSNHIIATAAVCSMADFKSVGIIRGEQPEQLSPTLLHALQYGMQLYFISRTAYQQKEIPAAVFQQYFEKDIYMIGEGGYGNKGMEGAMDILKTIEHKHYSHICTAVGTGTTLAGLAAAAAPHQQVIGISSLKNYFALEAEVRFLLTTSKNNFTILHDYHFGGYAKKTAALINFMNNWAQQTGIPSDFVYTAKLFYAIDQLIQKNYFQRGSQLLLIHSGGLQGNPSLPKGTLIF